MENSSVLNYSVQFQRFNKTTNAHLMDFEAVAKGQNISQDMKIFAIAFTIPKIHIEKSAKTHSNKIP